MLRKRQAQLLATEKNLTIVCILYYQVLPERGKLPIKIIQEPHSNETHSLSVGRT